MPGDDIILDSPPVPKHNLHYCNRDRWWVNPVCVMRPCTSLLLVWQRLRPFRDPLAWLSPLLIMSYPALPLSWFHRFSWKSQLDFLALIWIWIDFSSLLQKTVTSIGHVSNTGMMQMPALALWSTLTMDPMKFKDALHNIPEVQYCKPDCDSMIHRMAIRYRCWG